MTDNKFWTTIEDCLATCICSPKFRGNSICHLEIMAKLIFHQFALYRQPRHSRIVCYGIRTFGLSIWSINNRLLSAKIKKNSSKVTDHETWHNIRSLICWHYSISVVSSQTQRTHRKVLCTLRCLRCVRLAGNHTLADRPALYIILYLEFSAV